MLSMTKKYYIYTWRERMILKTRGLVRKIKAVCCQWHVTLDERTLSEHRHLITTTHYITVIQDTINIQDIDMYS
jgi:hypothetical protein